METAIVLAFVSVSVFLMWLFAERAKKRAWVDATWIISAMRARIKKLESDLERTKLILTQYEQDEEVVHNYPVFKRDSIEKEMN